MSKDARRVLEDALKLPTEVRSAIAAGLIESLDPELDEGAETAWKAETALRIKEISSGRVKTIPWAEARRRITGKLSKRSKR